jgi:ethylbenzene dioxygenase beta subunit
MFSHYGPVGRMHRLSARLPICPGPREFVRTMTRTELISPGDTRLGHDVLYREVLEWIYREAELLDDLREREWLETMVSRAIVYQMPIRQTVRRAAGRGFLAEAYHLNESYGSLLTRVRRAETEFAWAEDPPSPARHFVTNVRVSAVRDSEVDVRSNLLLFRTRGEQPQPNLISAERHDTLVRDGHSLWLLKRTVLLDQTVLETHNLSVLF